MEVVDLNPLISWEMDVGDRCTVSGTSSVVAQTDSLEAQPLCHLPMV